MIKLTTLGSEQDARQVGGWLQAPKPTLGPINRADPKGLPAPTYPAQSLRPQLPLPGGEARVQGCPLLLYAWVQSIFQNHSKQ